MTTACLPLPAQNFWASLYATALAPVVPPRIGAARAEIKYVPPSASMTPLDVAQPEIRTMAANAHDEATALPTRVFT
jgi:hypothetical protein